MQNAGKSTFVNVLATGQFEDDQIPTIGFNFREFYKKIKAGYEILINTGSFNDLKKIKDKNKQEWTDFYKSKRINIYI